MYIERKSCPDLVLTGYSFRTPWAGDLTLMNGACNLFIQKCYKSPSKEHQGSFFHYLLGLQIPP